MHVELMIKMLYPNDSEIIIDTDGQPCISLDQCDSGYTAPPNVLERWVNYYDLQEHKTSNNMAAVLKELNHYTITPITGTDMDKLPPVLKSLVENNNMHLYELRLKKMDNENE